MKPENSPPDDTSSPPKADPQPCACCGCTCCGDAPRRRDERISIKMSPERAEYLIRGSLRYVYF